MVGFVNPELDEDTTMEQIIGIVLTIAIVLFAVSKMAPEDSAARKIAVVVLAAAAAGLGSMWGWLQNLL